MSDITAIVLTYNEEKNIEGCITSIKNLVERVVVIDSFSTDNTVQKAEELGAEVYEHTFENQAKQFIWGMQNIDITTQWVLRLDADERISSEAAEEIQNLTEENTDTDINGILVRFSVKFLGKELKHGGIYPFCKLAVFKKDKAHMEERNMDEHIVLDEGRYVSVKSDSKHEDFKDLTAWIDKHNKYASREVMDYFARKEQAETHKNLNISAKIKRFVKMKIYYNLPMGTRAHLYFIYRYYFKLGFLDGKEGKIFCFLQAYWYRFLVDAKIYETELKENGK